jgi:hypothetical protein
MSWLNLLNPKVAKKVKSMLKGNTEPDLKEIHDKFFDKAGMKHRGYDIFREGIKGLEKKK